MAIANANSFKHQKDSVVKQKSYFNFLNLPLTVANFHAFRESFSQLYNASLTPCVYFTSPRPYFEKEDSNIKLQFSNETVQYEVDSARFFDSTYKINDIVCFFKTGIIFHSIQKIVISFPPNCSHRENCDLKNTIFICNRINYHYDSNLNLFRIISSDSNIYEVFYASEMSSFKPVEVVKNCLFPTTIGVLPSLSRYNTPHI